MIKRKTGLYGIDNFGFLLPRFFDYLKNPFKNPIKRVVHQSTLKRRPSADILRKQISGYNKSFSTDFQTYQKQITIGKTVLTEIIKIATRKGYKILVLESPLNPSYVSGQLPMGFYSAYKNNVQEFLKRYPKNVFYHDPSSDYTLDPMHFRDIIHLSNKDAINRYTNSVGQTLIQLTYNENE